VGGVLRQQFIQLQNGDQRGKYSPTEEEEKVPFQNFEAPKLITLNV
jgi:hypothetical protein